MLEESGYTVLAAAAIEFATFCQGAFEPDSSADFRHDHASDERPEMSEKLMLLRPDMKTLYLSGYTADIISSRDGRGCLGGRCLLFLYCR